MDKLKAHYPLADIQTVVAQLGAAALTKTALSGGHAMGLTTGEVLVTIASLTPRHCHKSMTTNADNKIWQDVYLAETPNKKTAYIKLTLRDNKPVIQFKEK
jgi:motility quorum-sensing regulator/GCU-specific mRNA interferase toxin